MGAAVKGSAITVTLLRSKASQSPPNLASTSLALRAESKASLSLLLVVNFSSLMRSSRLSDVFPSAIVRRAT